MPRLRTALLGSVAAGLTLPALAPAEIMEVGTGVPDAAPSCPTSPCLAISRTTGYQAKVGADRGLMTVKKDGRVVSWSITLSKPNAKQIEFFNEKLGGEAEAQITVIRPGRSLRHRVISRGEPVKLRRYFGKKVEFALQRTLRVRKGWIIGLTVPTWAPALAVNLPGDTSWRASRVKGECDDSEKQTAARGGTTAQFYCLYRTARLAYSARVVTDPEPAEEEQASDSRRR